ncbi:response regulator transcription factor [Planosporangium thailandense]|uniref:Response regulator transcription factor n=1 Tax=Planosporangium thailandense TaxID=765197 RepID=A0ABX0Y0Q6_9ACTN|nr:response regulator transcription factor [Planosporangium thailandense]NJC71034.1 response regulator transcription factor [Planosporangium thailandense]
MTSQPPAAPPIRVLIADDQKIVRDGLATLLGLLDGIEVVGTAVDGADAVRQTLTGDPDIVLMDLNMPAVDGVEATRQLVERGSRARVVVLTTYADDDWVFRALQAGARGFLTKDAGADEIQQAITTVAAGQAQLDPSVQRRLLEALAAGAKLGVTEPNAPTTVDDGLTSREVEVLIEVAEGHSNAEIATRLFVSEATVKTHINHLLAKTGCRDRAALVGYAYRTGRVTA